MGIYVDPPSVQGWYGGSKIVGIETLEPIFNENYTVVAMSCSNEYVPYLSVYLCSIIEHASDNHNYDLIVFERSITEENKRILKDFVERDNISLRFTNPMPILQQYSNLKFPPHYNLECYFRLTSPFILKNYDKIIFTDVDLVFQQDIANLYKININNALGACQDLVYCSFLDTPGLDYTDYATKELELKNPYKYFNTGVMLLNLDYFRQNQISEKLLDMANERQYRILEQDILNKFFKEDITYIDDAWNFPTMNPMYLKFMENLQEEYKLRYKKAHDNPYIIHWAGRAKPWLDPNTDLAYVWWQLARRTPYYEVILQRILNNVTKGFINSQILRLTGQVQESFGYRRNVLKYWRYKFLSKIMFGKKKEHYQNKKHVWKDKINAGKILLRKGK